MYECKGCGAQVDVVDGEIRRQCGHDGAGVLASLSVHCTAQGKLTVRTLLEQAIDQCSRHPHWGLGDDDRMQRLHAVLAAQGFVAEAVTELDGRPVLKMTSATEEAYLFAGVASRFSLGHHEHAARLEEESRARMAAEAAAQVEAWHAAHRGFR